jgi:hypothetical protein
LVENAVELCLHMASKGNTHSQLLLLAEASKPLQLESAVGHLQDAVQSDSLLAACRLLALQPSHQSQEEYMAIQHSMKCMLHTSGESVPPLVCTYIGALAERRAQDPSEFRECLVSLSIYMGTMTITSSDRTENQN